MKIETMFGLLQRRVRQTDGCSKLKVVDEVPGEAMVFFYWADPQSSKSLRVFGFGPTLERAALDALGWEGFS